MKKNVIMLVFFVTISLLAACNIQPNAPIPKETTPIETQATAWRLLPGPLDIVKSRITHGAATAIDSKGNPIVVWSESDGGNFYNYYVKRWTGNGWQQLGSNLNIKPSRFTGIPSIILDKMGQPIIAWEEGDTNVFFEGHIYVKRWDGMAWVQLGTRVDAPTTTDGSYPSMVIDNLGNPVVALTEEADGNSNVYVKRWNGTTWVQLGSALDVNISRGAFTPSLGIDTSGNLSVAWEEDNDVVEDIYVKRWNGTSWQQLGGALDVNPSASSEAPSLAVDSTGRPVVAWQEGSFDQKKLYVKRWTGSIWSQVGTSPLNISASQSAEFPFLVIDNMNQPMVAWHEGSVSRADIYLRRWNGSSWVNVGTNPLNVKTNHDARYSALALDGAGNPVVALQECDPASCFYDIHVKRYVANGWQALGKPLDITLTNEALNSSITRKSNDRPVVAWQEMGNIYAKEWNGTSWTRLGNKLNTNSGNNPLVAMRSDDKPVAAWIENGNQIFVKYWNGTSWQSQGTITDMPILSFAMAVGSSNNPVIAYSAFGNDGEATNIYVKRWNGSRWVGMNGSTVVAPLDIDRSKDAQVPALAVDSTGKPAVAWMEFAFGIQSIYVKQWTGTAWVQRGANLEVSPANNPSIDIDSTGKPVVAWQERVFDGSNTQGNIYVKRWSGTTWVNYGTGQMVDKFPTSDATKPVLQLRSDNTPLIAITQTIFRDSMNSQDIYMRRWNTTLNKWTDWGVLIDNNPAFNAKNPSMVLRSNSTPIVSWEEDDGSSYNVYVSQY